MKELREKVSIKTPLGIIHGHLFVGRGHLPECEVAVVDSWGNERRFTTSTFPNAWTLQYVLDPDAAPILYPAWQAITRIQSQIAQAQRRIEQEIEEGSDEALSR